MLALGVKAIFITLGALGLTSLWGAVFADVGVALLAILNASRVLQMPSVSLKHAICREVELLS